MGGIGTSYTQNTVQYVKISNEIELYIVILL